MELQSIYSYINDITVDTNVKLAATGPA